MKFSMCRDYTKIFSKIALCGKGEKKYENLQMIRTILFNPIPGGLWNYNVRRGGAIMAQVFSRRHNFTKGPPSTQNLLLDKYFDL